MTNVGRPSRLLAGALVVPIALALAGCGAKAAPQTAKAATLEPSPSVSPAPTIPPKPTVAPAPTGGPKTPPRYVFPIAEVPAAHFGHAHHDYPATDIFAACGDIYRAVTPGRILDVERIDHWRAATNLGAFRGGLSVTLLGDDGVRYYGSHLRSIDPATLLGRRVALGQTLGRVGNTGSARGIACHVHFGISPPCGTTDWFNRRGLLFPWPYLESWRAGGQASPVAAVSNYRRIHGCPTQPLAYP